MGCSCCWRAENGEPLDQGIGTWREGMNPAPASPGDEPGAKPSPAHPTSPIAGALPSGSWHTMAPVEHPRWRWERGRLRREEWAGVSQGELGCRGKGMDPSWSRSRKSPSKGKSQIPSFPALFPEDAALPWQRPPPLTASLFLLILHSQAMPSRIPMIPATARSHFHQHHAPMGTRGGCRHPAVGQWVLGWDLPCSRHRVSMRMEMLRSWMGLRATQE